MVSAGVGTFDAGRCADKNPSGANALQLGRLNFEMQWRFSSSDNLPFVLSHSAQRSVCVLPSTYSWLSCFHSLPNTTRAKASAVHRKLKQSISAGRSTASFLDIMWLLRVQDEK